MDKCDGHHLGGIGLYQVLDRAALSIEPRCYFPAIPSYQGLNFLSHSSVAGTMWSSITCGPVNALKT